MKNTIILSLGIALCLLFGCTKNSVSMISSPEPIIEQPKTFESFLPIDTGSYTLPKISISQGIGVVTQGINDSPSRTHVRIKKVYDGDEGEEGEEFFEATETGYIYSYTYSDLGVKITTPPLYDPYFFTKTTSPIFKRSGNIIYASGSTNFGAEYIEILGKDPMTSLHNQVQNKHLPSGCSIEITTGVNLNFFENKNFTSALLGDISYDIGCAPDKTFPSNSYNIVFLMNPKNPDTYYKVSFLDACAPGPCSIFGNIEFF